MGDEILISFHFVTKIQFISIHVHKIEKQNLTASHITVVEKHMTMFVIMPSSECNATDSTKHGEWIVPYQLSYQDAICKD